MTSTILIRFGIAMWISFMLMNLSFAAMGISLRRGGISIDWLSRSLNLRVRFAKVREVTSAYCEFKKGRRQFPLFAWATFAFASGLAIIPTAAVIYSLLVTT